MSLKDWADLAQLTLIPAILVSLSALWFAVNDNRKREIEKRNAEWQKVVIYSMLDKSPLSLGEISRELVAKATAYGLPKLGLEKIQDISIRSAILDLIASNVVLRLPATSLDAEDRYAPTRTQLSDPGLIFRALETERMKTLQQATDVKVIIEQNPGRFTEAGLADFIRLSTKLDAQVVTNLSSILSALEVQGLIGRNAGGKLVRVQRTPLPQSSKLLPDVGADS